MAYWTAKQVIKSSIDTGKVLLLEIVKRYVLNLWNSFDENREIKTNEIDKIHYLFELEAINNNLQQLVTNPLLIKLFIKRPSLTKLSMHLRREIAELKQSGSTLSVGKGTLVEVISLYDNIKPEFNRGFASMFKKDIFTTDEILKQVCDLIEELRKEYMPQQ